MVFCFRLAASRNPLLSGGLFACSHASPVIVLERDGVKCKCVENGGIVLYHSNVLSQQCPLPPNVAIKERETSTRPKKTTKRNEGWPRPL
jgi:hypothetical protein